MKKAKIFFLITVMAFMIIGTTAFAATETAPDMDLTLQATSSPPTFETATTYYKNDLQLTAPAPVGISGSTDQITVTPKKETAALPAKMTDYSARTTATTKSFALTASTYAEHTPAYAFGTTRPGPGILTS